ncbi:hypothetical protein CAPTEDRAFT_46591, partial [Capitella teleta]
SEEENVAVNETEQRLPNFYILGVRQTGAEVLTKILELHPQVVIAKSFEFFRREDRYNLGIEWYRSQMPLLKPNQILIEDANDLLIESKVPPRILVTNPSASFILVLCHPLKRIILDYLHIREFAQQNPSSEYNFQEIALNLTDLLLKNDVINYAYPGLYRSKYSKFFKMWLDNYSVNNFFVVDSDDLLMKSPIDVLDKLQDFLGISNSFAPVDFVYNDTSSQWCHTEINCSNMRQGSIDLPEDTVQTIKAYFKAYNQELYDYSRVTFDW